MPGHAQHYYYFGFTPDGRTLITASYDTTALAWEVPRRPLPAPAVLTASELNQLWEELAGDDAVRAYRAINRLIAAPGQAAIYFKARLKLAVALDAAQRKRFDQLLADLDSRRFEAREEAAKELEKMDESVLPALQEALTGGGSAEVRRRVEEILEKTQNGALLPQTLRALRAIETLERIGSEQARQTLAALAIGLPSARQTQEAKAAQERLARRLNP